MKLKLSYLLCLCFVTLFISCGDDEDPTTTIDNIVDLAQANSQFSSLVAALEKADLVATLEGAGPFTVFAPTDALCNRFVFYDQAFYFRHACQFLILLNNSFRFFQLSDCIFQDTISPVFSSGSSNPIRLLF